MPPIHQDAPTVALAGHVAEGPDRMLEFGGPTPVDVTVGPRRKPRRRYRTWPWMLAVVLVLVVLGVILLAMMLRGATMDRDGDLVGSVGYPADRLAVPSVT